MTEAVVGSGLSTVILALALFRINKNHGKQQSEQNDA
jgi:uncharacterized MnhB-related membrane protein